MSVEWISVEHELPDTEYQVLVYLIATDEQREHDKEICHVITAAIEKKFGVVRWYDFQSDEDIDQRLTEVTHWMPLPSPPEGEER